MVFTLFYDFSCRIQVVNKHTGKDYFRNIWPKTDYTIQFEHTHEIGLGNLDYDLENVTLIPA